MKRLLTEQGHFRDPDILVDNGTLVESCQNRELLFHWSEKINLSDTHGRGELKGFQFFFFAGCMQYAKKKNQARNLQHNKGENEKQHTRIETLKITSGLTFV